MQVDIDIPASMHAELATRHHHNAIRHMGNVYSTRDMATDDQAVLDVPQIQRSKRRATICSRSRRREINDTAREVRYDWRTSGVGSRRCKRNVN